MAIEILKKKRTHRPKGTRYPIVLAPGLFGFDSKVVSYFLGIAKYMNSLGCEVTSTSTETASVEKRAAFLRSQIDDFFRTTKADKVNIIAHSMGGLDSRYAISRLGMDDRVASLTTIAAPHHGTAVADWGTKRLTPMARLIKNLFNLDLLSLRDLTTESCKEFNQDVKNVEGIRYFTYSGSKEKAKTSPLLWPLYDLLKREEGDNDGLVSVRSARWLDDQDGVRYMGNFNADHLNFIGWKFDLEFLNTFDKKRFYRSVVEHLKRNKL
ncbi:MAG: esterase/lipase family protein [Planctomycetota bacterium]|jgi:triacylglycerol lipase